MSLPREAWGCGWWCKAGAHREPRLSRGLLSCRCVCQQSHICLTMLPWLQPTPHHLSHHCPNNLARHIFHWLSNLPWSFCPEGLHNPSAVLRLSLFSQTVPSPPQQGLLLRERAVHADAETCPARFSPSSVTPPLHSRSACRTSEPSFQITRRSLMPHEFIFSSI